MPEIFNLPTKEQFDMQNAILASIASHVGTNGMKISNWEDVQRIVRMGLADKAFAVGDQFVSKYGADSEIVWDVIGINHDIPTDKKYTNSLTIQAHDCILNAQFDAPEALYYAEEELPAGEHVFTQDGSEIKYKITTTQPIPAGGQIFLSFSGDYDNMAASTYAEDRITVIENGLAVTPTEDSDTLGEVNVRARCRYGSNNYAESNIREWLNSDESNYVWTPKTKFDRPSTSAPYTGSGFLKLLDPELTEVIGPVDKQVAKNTATDGGGQDLFNDKVFLLSRVEVGYGTEGATIGEAVYPYYDGISNAGRIKLFNGRPRDWWLRSPVVGVACGARCGCTTGVLGGSYVGYAFGLSPACVII